MSPIDLSAVWPMMIVAITAMVVLLADLWLPAQRKVMLACLSGTGLLVSAYFLFNLVGKGMTAFSNSVTADEFAIGFQSILLIISGLAICMSTKYLETKDINHGEYYALVLFATSGAMLMATSVELITIFIGLEVLSLSLYVLSGFARTDARSEESALKYFLLGAFASGFFLYGIALIYGAFGTTRLDFIAVAPAHMMSTQIAVAGLAMLIVGMGFKAAIVPFHNWTPDVYEGAPTTVTAFMSAAAKAGAFAAFIRIAATFLPVSHFFHAVLWVLAALTIVVGNVVAVQQTNIKRMLAYSSIAHAGYLLVGLMAQNPEGRSAILFYMLAYTFMNLGAFGVLVFLARRGQELNNIDDLKGLAQSQPIVAALMSIFMLSLAGLPPTIGFMGKWFLFLAAVHAHQYGLAVLGLVASIVGVFYYLRVIQVMYAEPGPREFPTDSWRFSRGAGFVIVVSAFVCIAVGIMPASLYDLSRSGGESLIVITHFQPSEKPANSGVSVGLVPVGFKDDRTGTP
ncbi:MAG: NADH-quinone oxidoreductase subunit N [Capsulimonadaceae bacterium]